MTPPGPAMLESPPSAVAPRAAIARLEVRWPCSVAAIAPMLGLDSQSLSLHERAEIIVTLVDLEAKRARLIIDIERAESISRIMLRDVDVAIAREDSMTHIDAMADSKRAFAISFDESGRLLYAWSGLLNDLAIPGGRCDPPRRAESLEDQPIAAAR